MKETVETLFDNELESLCELVRAFVDENDYEACIPPICHAMKKYPHAPHPHNLFGIVLEKMGDHVSAMKHFRAAWALDPTYIPATHNLHTYGTFFSKGSCAFSMADVAPPSPSNLEVVYDKRGVGRVVGENEVQYDENGVGRAVKRSKS